MRKNLQHIVDSEIGDCMRACITSMLDIPNDKKLPNIDNPNWYGRWRKFLNQFGISIGQDTKAIWREGYWMASVPSLNFEGGRHAIVMKSHKVAHDPSTKKRYKAGTDLLGTDVSFGWWLEIDDVSKLHKLEEYRKKADSKLLPK